MWVSKAPFSVTPIDRYSLKPRMFKIPVGYDFTLLRYMRDNINSYFSVEYYTVIYDARASEITKMQRSPYFVRHWTVRAEILWEVRLIESSF